MTVIVTWTDGTQETYSCERANVMTCGVLSLIPARFSEEPTRNIPLRNIKIWTEQT